MAETDYKVIVKSSISKTLFETNDAKLIEIFDQRGNLCGVLMRVVANNLWQVAVKGDPDFESFARKNGYKTATLEHPLNQPTVHGQFNIKP